MHSKMPHTHFLGYLGQSLPYAYTVAIKNLIIECEAITLTALSPLSFFGDNGANLNIYIIFVLYQTEINEI